VSHDHSTRARQARVLHALAARVDRGDEPMPTDVFNQVEGDLERRIDDEAIAEAWSMQDGAEAEPWAAVRVRIRR
jgi:hypothetical protein